MVSWGAGGPRPGLRGRPDDEEDDDHGRRAGLPLPAVERRDAPFDEEGA